TRQQGKWAGYSYIWNDEQTEATLVAAAGMDKTFMIADAPAPGGRREQKWHYPSRAECMVCHSRAANFVLGPSLLQMNKDHDYGGVIDNQVGALEHMGVVRVNQLEHFQEAKKNVQALRQTVRSLVGAMPESLLEKAIGKLPRVQQVAKDVAAAEKQLADKATYTTRL